jgi:hypothetical protein
MPARWALLYGGEVRLLAAALGELLAELGRGGNAVVAHSLIANGGDGSGVRYDRRASCPLMERHTDLGRGRDAIVPDGPIPDGGDRWGNLGYSGRASALIEHLPDLGRGGDAFLARGPVLSAGRGGEDGGDCGCSGDYESILAFHKFVFRGRPAAEFSFSKVNTPQAEESLDEFVAGEDR